LCFEFKLDPINDIFLHQEIVGWKDCHRFFVNNPKEWIKFKNTVKNKLVERMIDMVKKAWEQELGEKSLDSLSKKGKVNNVEDWKKKDLKSESTPLWLFFTMLDRLTN
jgi:N-acetylmuramoyl-L-alanine amidase